jgi:transcriptional regulator with XRE-family HTH domain
MKKRMDQVCKVLADNVKTLRLASSLTQEELALQAEVDRTYVSQIERGIGNPSVLILVKLSDVLGVEVRDLFDKNK